MKSFSFLWLLEELVFLLRRPKFILDHERKILWFVDLEALPIIMPLVTENISEQTNCTADKKVSQLRYISVCKLLATLQLIS